MNQSNLLERAQQGEPGAIAALMNSALAPKGVTARVDVEGDCLYVMFESTQSLNPDTLMRFTHRGLQELDAGVVRTVKLYEQKIGENTISWKREFAVGLPLALPVAQVVPDAIAGVGDEDDFGTPLPLGELIDQVEVDQFPLDQPLPDPGEEELDLTSADHLAADDRHAVIKTFWRKQPILFTLLVGFAFMSGGGAALLMASSQKQAGSIAGKQQEAETYLREMNEAQRAFYGQNNRFATTLEELERSANMFSKAYYYAYKLEAKAQAQAKITAVPKEPGLKSYVGAVFVKAAQVTTIICQTQQASELLLPVPKLTNNQPQCPDGTTILP